jgi:hypothetical protein
MKGFVGDIEHSTKENSDFRRVLYTGKIKILRRLAMVSSASSSHA